MADPGAPSIPTDGPESADPAASLDIGALDIGGLDIGALGRLAVKVALAAGRLIVDGRPDGLVASATKSSPTDVVTVMDTRSEELIRAHLLAVRPDDGIHGEEGADHIGTSAVTWVVDPIDGTVNYLYGIPAYAVSIAAVTGDPRTPGKWAVLAAAVADPSLEIVYHDERPARRRARRPRGCAGGDRLRLHAAATP